MTVAGIFLAVFGIIDISKGRSGSGIISLAAGIAVLILGWALVDLVLLVLGLIIALKGVVDLIDVTKLPKKQRTLVRYLLPAATILVGLMLAFGNGAGVIITVVGILLIVDGVASLITNK